MDLFSRQIIGWAMIDLLKAQYPVQVLCETLDCPRSSYYYEAVEADEAPLVETIEQIILRFSFYRYRRLTAELGRQGWQVNEKVVRRMMKQMGLQGKVRQVKITTTDSAHSLPRYPNLIRSVTPISPNQVWVADITYIRLADRFIYLAVVLDVYTWAVRGWFVSKSVSHTLSLEALKQALRKGTPVLHHSDQGVQYAAKGYTDLLKEDGIQISMSEPSCPTQNAFAERFMRTFKEEHVDHSDYRDFEDARQQIGHWIEEVYMKQRIHSALEYLTPAEFEAAYVDAAQSVTLNR
jgi:transposase InsO family protein